ncbi:MAG: hypothetical protein QGF24_10200 [Dehalococcoidia bacterium]|nr:hypothetical protein [Dehalococcoidia bacterium]
MPACDHIPDIHVTAGSIDFSALQIEIGGRLDLIDRLPFLICLKVRPCYNPSGVTSRPDIVTEIAEQGFLHRLSGISWSSRPPESLGDLRD